MLLKLPLKESRRNQKANPPKPPHRTVERSPCQFRKVKRKKKKEYINSLMWKTGVFLFLTFYIYFKCEPRLYLTTPLPCKPICR